MTVKLELPPQVEAELLAQARAEGLLLDQFLQRKLEAMAQAPPPDTGNAISADAWEKELESWFDSFPQGTVLPEAAFHREDWYPDRW
jgi:hypothetical protein